MRYAVIMAGGAGTRLWPMSRSGRPKQLLRIIPGNDGVPRSLLQIAAGRLRGLIDGANVYVCTGAAYANKVLDDLPLLGDRQLLGEPTGRDTLSAVGFSAAVLAKRDPEAVFAVLTADHIIEPVEVFQEALEKAFAAVEKDGRYLLTFGITPTHAATGFGYLRRGDELPGLPGVHRVEAFKEKPKEDVAREYFASGKYAWNSGMFVWKASTILEEIRRQVPAAYEGLMTIAAAWDTPGQQAVLEAVYPTLPKISIDFGVMEKAQHVATVAMPVKWLDVGSWPSFGETLAADAAGNRGAGAVAVHLDSSNTLVVSEEPGHVVATIGCHDVIVIHTPRATLVCPAKDAERIKQMVAQVEATAGKEFVQMGMLDDAIPERYEKNPMLAVLENYVLDAIGKLPAEKAQMINAMLCKTFGGSDWKAIIREQFDLPRETEENLRQMWKQAAEEAEAGQANLSPEEFACRTVDTLFSDLGN